MTIERELTRLLRGADHEVHATLRRYFRPTPRSRAPMFFDWVPLPDLGVVLGDEPGGGLYEAAARRADGVQTAVTPHPERSAAAAATLRRLVWQATRARGLEP